jgi:biopolymer transport protein TolR
MGMGTGGRGGSTLSEINVTPLVDVMVVLLIIFMVATPLIKKEDAENREIKMDLPVTKDNPNTVNPKEVQELILEVDAELKVRIGDVVISDCSAQRVGKDPKRFEPCFQEIEGKLKNNAKLQEDKRLYLLADTEIPYGFVVGVMNRIKLAGVDNVGMVTNPEYVTETP